MAKQQGPTYEEIARQIILGLDGPIDMDEFIQRILSVKPSRAKNPRQVILSALWGQQGNLFVRPDPKTLVPLHVAMKGIRFRWTLSRPEVEQGKLLVQPTFLGYVSQPSSSLKWLHLEDSEGNVVPVNEDNLTIDAKELTGEDVDSHSVMAPAINLTSWMQANHVKEGGSILFTVRAWEERKRVFKLEYETPMAWEAYHNQVIKQNDFFEETLFNILEQERDEMIWVSRAIPLAHVLMDGPRDLPGFHWAVAVMLKERMRFDEVFITYIDSRRGFWYGFEQSPVIKPEKGTSERKSKVFRFTVSLPYHKSSKHQVEMLGNQTIHDLDRAIRIAFKHDTMDHLSGFWKLIRRGNTNRYREVDIGKVYPFWPDEEAINDVLVADLDLDVGDLMKYVYDFGDWIEHKVVLESIDNPDPETSYPKIVRKQRKSTRKKK